jgi:hypothetical protein
LKVEAKPDRRLLRGISASRLLLGLALAPVLPAFLGMLFVGLPRGDFSNSDNWFIWETATLLAPPWSVIAGGAYILHQRRGNGTIGRSTCLALGTMLAAVQPTVHLILWLGVTGIREGFLGLPVLNGMPFAAMAGVVTIPLGLLGGWLFWRIVMLPTKMPPATLASIFD